MISTIILINNKATLLQEEVVALDHLMVVIAQTTKEMTMTITDVTTTTDTEPLDNHTNNMNAIAHLSSTTIKYPYSKRP
jgi:phage-related protein